MKEMIRMNGNNGNLRKIILTGLMTALVYLFTSIIKIPTVNGYIHLGDGFIFLSTLILGPFYGAFASGVGSMLSDVLSQYAQWAIPTLIIKSSMALVMGLVLRHRNRKEIVISAATTVTVWVAFFVVIKNALARAVVYSVDSLASALEDTPENVINAASDTQWKLTAAIAAVIIIMFAIILYMVRKKNIEGIGVGVILGMLSSGAVMVIGYYIADFILYGNPISPVFSVPMNLIQLLIGIVITVAIAPALLKAKAFYFGDKDRSDSTTEPQSPER
ncbi:ECF transporter S component [Thermoclostridium stercorarium]|jgi:uncharacterized membrane protein|nr:ECF transporter S component [Thermoclostridium stercorarium]